MSVWRTFFDGMFCFSSALLAIFFGAALANVIRGVPLGPDGYFFLPLWTNWLPGAQPGILDWYTVLGGVIAFVALAVHGALYLAVKTEGPLQSRARKFAQSAWFALVVLTVVSLPASIFVRKDTLDNYRAFPLAFAAPVLVLLGLAGMIGFSRKGDDRKAFGSSCVYLAVMLVGATVGLYPRLLPSSSDPALDITIARALSGPYTLHVGLIWWTFGMLLAVAYFVVVYRLFKGKVRMDEEGYGH
jgi:cytochrome d ubiquinol oxidase subunit II